MKGSRVGVLVGLLAATIDCGAGALDERPPIDQSTAGDFDWVQLFVLGVLR